MTDSQNTPLRITVFGHSELEVCLISGCGSEIQSSEAADELRVTLRSWFENRVAVRHYDLADAELSGQFAGILEGARERNLPFPLIAINGDIVFAGPVSVDVVLRKLGERLEST